MSDNHASDLTRLARTPPLQAEIDVGLRQFLLSVYNYMASGLALTGTARERTRRNRPDTPHARPKGAENLRRKLPSGAPARLLAMDSSDLKLPNASYDRALLFFLLHEQPELYRERTLSDVFRVVRPGGEIVIVDYALPRWWHPLRYLWRPLLATLEPFALDLWRHQIVHWLPLASRGGWRKQSFFGGLYQKVIIKR